MQLDEALRQISDIRQQMVRSRVFRGYRSATVAFSGLLGLAVAVCQPYVVASPHNDLPRYLLLWISAAAVSVVVAGVEMWWRARLIESAAAHRMMLLAVEQFLPSLVVGALLTLCIFVSTPQVASLLPGLWSLIFSIGVFASYRVLPRQVFWVGVYYVLCGCGCLVWGRGEHVLSPWQMGISFGGGQLLAAAVLYWTLERTDVSSPNE